MTPIDSLEEVSQVYESDRLLGEYLLFHYGDAKEQFPWTDGPKEALGFPSRSVLELVDTNAPVHSALDLGCAVGKSSFVLAELANRVIGIDFSESFIRAARTILKGGKLNYQYLEEGCHLKEGIVEISNPPENLTFERGDACDLRTDIESFDLVHAANLLCRLPDPKILLNRLPQLVKPGGQLLLTTPFTWLEEFTPQSNWLDQGGSDNALKNFLSPEFELEQEKNLPFLIREHRRKFQYTVALGMRWRRKGSV